MRLGAGSVDGFLDGLASRAPTPGGGSAAALIGALGAALTAMVCELTLGRRKFAAAAAEMTDVLARAKAARAALQDAVERDVAAFDAVIAAMALPKARPDEQRVRAAAMQRALREAAEVPLLCARQCAAVIALAARAAEHGNPRVVSDAGVAALAADAALRGAALNVYVNAAELEDRGLAEEMLQEIDALAETARADAETVYAGVRARLL